MIPGGRTVECDIRPVAVKAEVIQCEYDNDNEGLKAIATTLKGKSSTVSHNKPTVLNLCMCLVSSLWSSEMIIPEHSCLSHEQAFSHVERSRILRCVWD